MWWRRHRTTLDGAASRARRGCLTATGSVRSKALTLFNTDLAKKQRPLSVSTPKNMMMVLLISTTLAMVLSHLQLVDAQHQGQARPRPDLVANSVKRQLSTTDDVSRTAGNQSFKVTGACSASYIEDVYAPVAFTNNGRWYYKGVAGGRTLYFDSDCDGTGSSSRWIFDDSVDLSTTASHDLDEDGSCSYIAYNWDSNYDTEPPVGTHLWRTYCGSASGWVNADLTIVVLNSPSSSPTSTANPTITMEPTAAPTICADTDGDLTDSWDDVCESYAGHPEWCGGFDDSDFTADDLCCTCGGGGLPVVCSNTAFGALDSYGDRCVDYAGNTHWCTLYDDDDFSSEDMCCVCGGGAGPTPVPTVSPAPERTPECFDSDVSVTDSWGTGCTAYLYVSWCGGYDDSDFSADEACCICGGGSTTAPPTPIPTTPPTVTPAPSHDGIYCLDTDDGVTDSAEATCVYYSVDTQLCGSVAHDDFDFSSRSMCCACGGGSSFECANTDSGETDVYGETCAGFTANPHWCGTFDDDDFSSNDLCCACGGGDVISLAPTVTSPPTSTPAPTPIPETCLATCYGRTCEGWDGTCATLEAFYDCDCTGCDCGCYDDGCCDTSGEAVASNGVACGGFATNPNLCDYDSFNDADFTAGEMCCACGGGSMSPAPSSGPTVNGTAKPTSNQQIVTAQTWMVLNSESSVHGAEIDVTQDITFANRISIQAISVRIASTTDAAFIGGGAASFFDVKNSGTLELESLTLIGGSANTETDKRGGAIYVAYDGILMLLACTLTDNSAEDYGGALYTTYDSVGTFTSCVFARNRAWGEYADGGALAIVEASNTVTSCTFTDNYAGMYGGATAMWYSTDVTFMQCVFSTNEARSLGGAVYLTSSTATFTRCDFDANLATIYHGGAVSGGGGMYSNCTFQHNTAHSDGGALHARSGSVDGCRFHENTARYGGALYAEGIVEIFRSIITNNRALVQGAAVYSIDEITVADSVVRGFGSVASEAEHIFHHASTFVLWLDTVSFENNDLAVLSAEPNTVMIRNCDGLSTNDVDDSSLITCDHQDIAKYCTLDTRVICTDVVAGIQVCAPCLQPSAPLNLTNLTHDSLPLRSATATRMAPKQTPPTAPATRAVG